jgi:crotonobetainyl-CoA:carnitine CoA-transferase CaiB-like acyl-CoA transferase
MTTDVMSGVRVVEVAEHTFVPAASALLAGWGADVIKVEPVGRGDAVRGLAASAKGDVHVLHEHSNRGKRGIALDLSSPEGVGILYKLVASADVFMTNKVGRVRRKLKIEVDDLRAHNPNLVYVRGTGWGERGEHADRGGYDLLGFWHRSGASIGAAGVDGRAPFLPGPAFGDSIGAMTIAGGTMGALFHRERTGEAKVLDVSLLSTGMWAMGAAITAANLVDDWTWPPGARNPLSATYQTKDGRWFALCCLQAGYYWAPLCETIGRPDLAIDPRFADQASILANGEDASSLLAAIFVERTADEWEKRFENFVGQWTVVQDARRAGTDPQAIANDYVQECVSRTGVQFKLVSAPVQYDERPAPAAMAPQYNEHGDEILAELGIDWDTIVDLKVRNIVG